MARLPNCCQPCSAICLWLIVIVGLWFESGASPVICLAQSPGDRDHPFTAGLANLQQEAVHSGSDSTTTARERVDRALQTLDYTQPPSSALLADLKLLVESRAVDDLVRRRAAMAMARLGPQAPTGVASLEQILSRIEVGTEPERSAMWVLPALGRYGSLAHPSAARIASIAFDNGYPPDIQLSAVSALVEMGVTREGLTVIEKLLTNPRLPLELRTAGMQGVIAYRQEASTMLPQILRWLDDENPALRAMAAEAIAGFGERALVAEEPLAVMFLDDPSPVARESAARAMIAISPQPAPWMIGLYDETLEETGRVQAALAAIDDSSGSSENAVALKADLTLKLAALRMRQIEILRFIGNTKDWKRASPSSSELARAKDLPASSGQVDQQAWLKRLEEALSSDSMPINLVALEILLGSNRIAGMPWQPAIQRGLLSAIPEERRSTVRLFQKYAWDQQSHLWLEGVFKDLQAKALKVETQTPAIDSAESPRERNEILQRPDRLITADINRHDDASDQRLRLQQMAAVRAALRTFETRKVSAP